MESKECDEQHTLQPSHSAIGAIELLQSSRSATPQALDPLALGLPVDETIRTASRLLSNANESKGGDQQAVDRFASQVTSVEAGRAGSAGNMQPPSLQMVHMAPQSTSNSSRNTNPLRALHQQGIHWHC
jgi:hypothetical protein